MKLPDAEDLFQTFAEQLQPMVTSNTALVGIHRGGVWLMERMRSILGDRVSYGSLDAAFYRDDFSQRGLRQTSKAAQIPFQVEDKHIILIDDIFYTGRTTRAAMNELFDYGRPASIALAVLIDRGGRQLPIVPQVSAAQIPLLVHQRFALSQDTRGRLHLALEEQVDA